MIAKIAIPIVIAVVFGALCFDRWHWRYRLRWQRCLLWMLPLTAIIATALMARLPDYFPSDIRILEVYMLMLCVIAAPLVLVALSGLIGLCVHRRRGGETVGWLLSAAALAVFVWGETTGARQLRVKHVEMTFSDLPAAFDGYKIVHFSDAHLGSAIGCRAQLLREAVDSINAQHADAVAFTGDLQNMRPEEVQPFKALLAGIRAKDGVFSVLGNHDYCEYVSTDDPFEISRQMGLTISTHEEMGWTLLDNSRVRLRRDSDALVIAGMANDGEGRFPQFGDINSALWRVSRREFVVMLEHDPTSWRRKILTHSHAQLTLSGHTHGGQMRLFGWSPASLAYHEYAGVYAIGERRLHVSTGLGGVVPFRLGVPPEIVVITLRRNSPKESGADNK